MSGFARSLGCLFARGAAMIRRCLPGTRPCAVERVPGTVSRPARAIWDTHTLLDSEIERKLQEVVADTELSAHEIVRHVRSLYDAASTIVNYLDQSHASAQTLGQEVVHSVGQLNEIRDFLEYLPEKIERSLETVQVVGNEIKELGKLVGAVQAISMQSHLLAINAAIEASRAGPAGRAFRVVADEIRILASNSNEAAVRISEGLMRTRAAIEGSMKDSITESSQQLDKISHAKSAIQKLQDNFEDMNQYYKTRFAVVTRHNQQLSSDIAGVLGQTQYQDVVRQCIERIQATMRQRNDVLQQSVLAEKWSPEQASATAAGLENVLDRFVAEESKHVHSARLDSGSDGNGAPKIELF